jgi:hypothetical protein
MKNSDARELAKTITNDQLKRMLDRAKIGIKDWTVASKSNIGFSRGCHWNIMCRGYASKNEFSTILKFRMIQEYNEFLDDELKPPKIIKSIQKTIHHDPIFD